MLFVQFAVSAVIIVAAGVKLTSYADLLSDRLQWGKVWIGVALLGLITSLPEAVSSLTAVYFLKAYDLAVANMVGSNNFNIMLIVVMDLLYREGSFTNRIVFSWPQISPALIAGGMTLIVMAAIGLRPQWISPVIQGIGVESFLLLAAYMGGMFLLKRSSHASVKAVASLHSEQELLSKMIIVIVVSALLVVIGAVFLAQAAEGIAEVTGMGQTFVGAIFLAIVTSLPEMVVTVSALKLGSLDMAVGNIFGSNMANLFIVFLCDALHREGSLWTLISGTHLLTASLGFVMTVIVLAGIRNNSKKVFLRMGWDSWSISLLFLGGLGALYCFK